MKEWVLWALIGGVLMVGFYDSWDSPKKNTAGLVQHCIPITNAGNTWHQIAIAKVYDMEIKRIGNEWRKSQLFDFYKTPQEEGSYDGRKISW